MIPRLEAEMQCALGDIFSFFSPTSAQLLNYCLFLFHLSVTMCGLVLEVLSPVAWFRRLTFAMGARFFFSM